jgi:hypothetical protein
MEQQFRELCACILDISKLEETITTNKLSYTEVNAMMDFIDIKHRGFLDLNDVFELVGKVTEKELFDIFKFLDRNRSGEIRVEELQSAIGNSELTSRNTTKEYVFPKFYAIVDTVKDKPKKISEIKQKYAPSVSALKNIYQCIGQLLQSKYLSQDDLSTVFKNQFSKN